MCTALLPALLLVFAALALEKPVAAGGGLPVSRFFVCGPQYWHGGLP